MFIGTASGGAMPTFEWNLVMCFLMGASAGGMLPIPCTLMAETVPAAHRARLLVALSGAATSDGSLLAAGHPATLEPPLSSLSLWPLNLPHGLVILSFNCSTPAAPRFLLYH